MRESDIRARLGRLPKGLTSVYDEIINSIKSQPDCNLNLAMQALQWMLVSQRPLKPAELVTAAELNPSLIPVGSASSHESALEVELLIQSCEGLLVLDITLDVVRFSHLSVQEYLEAQNTIIRITDAQLFVSQCCLWTLQYGHSSSPLYEYAACNWFRHCRSYEDLVLATTNLKDPRHELCIPLLNRFLGSFEEASTSYVKWAKWVVGNSHIARAGWDYRYPLLDVVSTTPPCPAFSAALAGLGELVGWLWDSEVNDMKIETDHGTSLLAVASEYGKTWVVAEMLKADFEIDTVQKALDPACSAGKLDTVKLLLDHGADVNLLGPFGHTALVGPASNGHLEVVIFLLDRGVDVNCNQGRALAMAAGYGYLEVVKVLLDRGADINPSRNSPLVDAACEGKLEIVDFLLKQGADVNLRGGGYLGTALAAAAYHCHPEIVTLLLDQGADVNLPTGCDYDTALCAAADSGNSETITLLLDRGADVNAGGHYGTALGAAASTGNMEMATLLLEHGADVNLTGGEYYTALSAAASTGNTDMVTLLLEHGADVNLTGGEYGTALGAAASGGKLWAVELLIDRGANLNLANNEGARPCDLAAQEGHQDIVALLDSWHAVNTMMGVY